MLEKVLDLKKKSMFLTDTSEDIDAHFRYIASKKKIDVFLEVDTPIQCINIKYTSSLT